MAEQFYTILTKIGKAKIANASALGTKVNFSKFQVGDSNGSYYNPTEDQTSLKNKVWEGNINSISIDKDNPNWIIIEVLLPSNVGGFMVREAAILDDENNIIAIAKYPETYKPVTSEGSSKDLLIRTILEISNTSSVTLKVDPTVILATKKDIEQINKNIDNSLKVINEDMYKLALNQQESLFKTISSSDSIISLENTTNGIASIEIYGNTKYKRTDGTYINTWESGVTLESVGEKEGNKISVLSKKSDISIGDKLDIVLKEPLRGLPNGVKDAIDSNGVLTRRTSKITLNGSEGWENRINEVVSDNENIIFSLKNMFIYKKPSTMIATVKCDSCDAVTSAYSKKEGLYWYYNKTDVNNNYCIYYVITKSKLSTTDIAGFKKYLLENPVTIYYELQTPIIENIGTPLMLQSFKNGTLQINTAIAPYTTTIKYTTNLKGQADSNSSAIKVQMNKIALLNTDIELYKAETTKQIGNINDSTLPSELKGKSLTEQTKILFQSASNGKIKIANAVTGKGQPTSMNDTWDKMASNIEKIRTGGVGITEIVGSSHSVTNAPCDIPQIRLEFYNRIFANNIGTLSIVKNDTKQVWSGSWTINTGNSSNISDVECMYLTINESFYPGTKYKIIIPDGALKDKLGYAFKGMEYSFYTNPNPSVWVMNPGRLNIARQSLASCGTQDAGLSFGGSYRAGNQNITEKFNGDTWSTVGNDLNTYRYELAGCGTQNAGLSFGGNNGNVKTEKFNGDTWSTTGNLNIGRTSLAGCGTQDAGLSFGGSNKSTGATEKFNGSTWSLTGNLSHEKKSLAGCGTQNAGLSFGGDEGTAGKYIVNATEKFNGSTWSLTGNLNAKKTQLAGCGTQDAGLSFGGTNENLNNYISQTTEKFNGSTWSTTGNLNVGRTLLAGCGTQNTGLSFGGNDGNYDYSNITEKFFG